MNSIKGLIVLSPGHKTTATEDEGVVPDVQDDHLLSINEEAQLDIGDAESEGDVEDDEREEPPKDAKTAVDKNTENKEHNNNDNKPKPKASGLTLESMGQIISVPAPSSNQANIHRVPTASQEL